MKHTFDLILADPPWRYDNKRTGGSLKSGAAQIYDVMSLEAIRELPVADVAARDALCCLWVTSPMLPEGLSVLERWGFKYKTAWPWIKTGRLGLGFWGRVDVEYLLIGVRGHVRPPRFGSIRSSLSAPVGAHSAKPEAMRARIELMAAACFDRPFAEVRAVELFARRQAPGWTCVGNAIDGGSIESWLQSNLEG